MLSAISAIDVAIWDLKGKILKQPVSTLLGGRYREKVQVYATGLYFTESMKDRMCEALAEEALMYKEQGYSAVKMKVGLGIEKDIQNVLAVKKAIGDDVKLAIEMCIRDRYRDRCGGILVLSSSWQRAVV